MRAGALLCPATAPRRAAVPVVRIDVLRTHLDAEPARLALGVVDDLGEQSLRLVGRFVEQMRGQMAVDDELDARRAALEEGERLVVEEKRFEAFECGFVEYRASPSHAVDAKLVAPHPLDEPLEPLCEGPAGAGKGRCHRAVRRVGNSG